MSVDHMTNDFTQKNSLVATGAQPALHFGRGNFHELSFDDVIVLIQL